MTSRDIFWMKRQSEEMSTNSAVPAAAAAVLPWSFGVYCSAIGDVAARAFGGGLCRGHHGDGKCGLLAVRSLGLKNNHVFPYAMPPPMVKFFESWTNMR